MIFKYFLRGCAIVITIIAFGYLSLLRSNAITIITNVSNNFLTPTPTPTATPASGADCTAFTTAAGQNVDAGATCSDGPTPKPLSSPIVAIAAGQPLKNLAGASLGLCTTVGNGTISGSGTDDSSCFQSAANNGNIILVTNDICTANTTFSSGSGGSLISGTNSCCTGSGTGTCNPNTGYLVNSTVNVLATSIRGGTGVNPTVDGANIIWSQKLSSFSEFNSGTGSIMGISFRGPNYNNPAVACSDGGGGRPQFNSEFITVANGSGLSGYGSSFIAQNDFNGMDGINAALVIFGNSSNDSFNTFKNCCYEGTQVSGSIGTGTILSHNAYFDCGEDVQPGGNPSDVPVNISYIYSNFSHGAGNGAANLQEAGVSSSGVAYSPGFAGNYLVTSVCTGTVDTPQIIEALVSGSNSTGCPSYGKAACSLTNPPACCPNNCANKVSGTCSVYTDSVPCTVNGP